MSLNPTQSNLINPNLQTHNDHRPCFLLFAISEITVYQLPLGQVSPIISITLQLLIQPLSFSSPLTPITS